MESGNLSAQERTRARIEELVKKYVGEGMLPDQAAAKAIMEIRSTAKPKDSPKLSNKLASPKPDPTPALPKPKINPEILKGKIEEPAVLTTDAAEFIQYLNREPNDEIIKFIKNTFGNVQSLAGSFKLQVTEEDKHKSNLVGSNVDWDGLKRVYEEIEAKDMQDHLSEALGSLNKQMKNTVCIHLKSENRDALLASIMSLMNPQITSPCYLQETEDFISRVNQGRGGHFLNLCDFIVHILCETEAPSNSIRGRLSNTKKDLANSINFIKTFSLIPVPDMLQTVKNIQQAITIRCVELDEVEAIHEDPAIITFVQTLELLFYSSLLASKTDDQDWRTDSLKNSSTSIQLTDSSGPSGSGGLVNQGQTSTEESTEEPMDIAHSTEDEADDDDIDGIVPVTDDQRRIENILKGNSGNSKKDRNSFEKALNLNWCSIESPVIPYVEFLNEVVNNALNVQDDFINGHPHLGRSAMDLFDDDRPRFSFISYPFILSTEKKSKYLLYDSKVKQMLSRRTAAIEDMMQGNRYTLPYLHLIVPRNNIVQETMMRLEIVVADNPSDLQKQLFVEFEGEEGVDEGGLSKEFFTLVIAEIFKPEYGMFYLNSENDYYFFNRVQFQDTEKEYMLIGMLLGLAIYNCIILDIAFPTVIFKKLSGHKGQFQDLEDFEPDIYRSMSQMLEMPESEVADLELTFTASLTSMFGDTEEVELIQDGKNIKITADNRHQYVDSYADFLLNKSIEKSFHAFQRGFDLVTFNSPLTALFRPKELEEIVIGQRQYDWTAFKESCRYDGGFNKDHATIQNFWSVFEDLDENEKKAFLEFFSGSDRVPVGGLGKLRPKIQSCGPDSDRLPTAHTCFNILLLPSYTTRDKLKDRLLKAIQNAKGFGMI